MSGSEPRPFVSAVVPFFNEEGNALPLLAELENALARIGRPFEVICVDDCSTDGTAAELESWRAGHAGCLILRHRARAGQSAAIASGFRAARGEVVVTLDGDGQNDPASIPAMLELLVPGVSAVLGVRSKRMDTAMKRFSSAVAGAFRNAVTGDVSADAGCGLRVIRRSALAEIPVFNGMHRFLPAMLRYQGATVVETAVAHRPRTRGKSKYGIGNRMWRGIRDCAAMRWYGARCFPADRLADGD
jgi:dolichol-phosphate mannosyltransferase